MNVHIAMRSRNVKTGPIPVTTTSSDTCPGSCPFRGSGCYADGGPLAMHWRAVSRGLRGTGWRDLLATIADLPLGQLWRHNQAGDLPGKGDAIDTAKLRELSRANAGKRGFTYTHKPVEVSPQATPSARRLARRNLAAIAAANGAGFVVNISANSPGHADSLADGPAQGLPLVTVLPADVDGAATPVLKTPAGRVISVCPATYREDVSCATCGLCARGNRKSIVGFPAHGASRKKASNVVEARA
jgi:hypothetical protein